MIKLHEYLAVFPVAKTGDTTGEMELNEIILNSIPNGYIRQAYVEGFDCEYITLKICKYV